MSMPKKIKIVEVGPRDGLQNETKIIDTAVKINLINQLSEAGFTTIETTSFVSPKWVPQMADHQQVYQGINKKSGVSYPVLVPNFQGFEAALTNQVKEIAVFTAASNTFTQKNINCSIDESFIRIAPVIKAALAENIKVRGYVSCILGCPYEGEVTSDVVAATAQRLFDLGCYEISLGDTIAIGTPFKALKIFEAVSKKVPIAHLAGHFHDTYGQALVNIFAVMSLGISTFDSSLAGLGGCPYAVGASGNVATEDLLFMLQGLGIETDINLKEVLKISDYLCQQLGHNSRSKVALAMKGNHNEQ